MSLTTSRIRNPKQWRDHSEARIRQAVEEPRKRDLYADLAQAVRNTIATPENAVPPDTTPVNAAFTKKAQGIPRKGGKIQFNMSWPKEMFERIRDEAFAANRSFSEQAMIYFRRGMQNEEGAPHGN